LANRKSDLEWQKPDEMDDAAAKHHVVGIDRQVSDNLADGNSVARKVPH